jgi:prepilin-type N-terminal cleavage/methylation domain-containing protein
MKKAFTLIELLVVIAIIAILAAILFPVFAQAKMAAKKSSDLSNTKQQGIALQIYLQDFDDTFPQAYYYANDSSSAGGYVQWSGLLQPYIKNLQIFVSPVDDLKGMAPTNFSTASNNKGAGFPGGQTPQVNADIDIQAPRLSYVANAAVMPRKRRTIDPANVVNATSIDSVSQTIVITAMTSIPACINDVSSASGVAYKSHRPTNAVMRDQGNTIPFIGEAPAEYGAPLWALSTQKAIADLKSCRTNSALGLSHIVYSSPYRFGGSDQKPGEGGANYVFADCSAKFYSLGATLNPNRYLWGTRMYSAGGAQMYRAGTAAVPGNEVN